MAKFFIKIHPSGEKSETGKIQIEVDTQDSVYIKIISGEREDLCMLRNNLLADIRNREYQSELLGKCVNVVKPEVLAKSMKRNLLFSVYDFGIMLMNLILAIFYGVSLDNPAAIIFALLSVLLLICGLRAFRNARNLAEAIKEQAELEAQRRAFDEMTDRIKNLKKAVDAKLGFDRGPC